MKSIHLGYRFVVSCSMDIPRYGRMVVVSLGVITFALATVRAGVLDTVPCLEDGKFYRNPSQKPHRRWLTSECAKYYLCLDGEVFEFKCSTGLLFDVKRQICDFKANVDNCDVYSNSRVPKPLLEAAKCESSTHLGCADGTCITGEYFCDGSVDCPDGSDETWCDKENDPNAAPLCDYKRCRLPDCFCSKDSTITPNNMEVNQVPQMIILTFDDAITDENWELYTKKIFTAERKNENSCPISGTFYVSHQYTNYQKVQKLWNDGHEIAVHSITRRGPEDWWSYNATIEDWFDEMVGQANIINRFANVRLEDLRGLRVPFLKVGWNRQFLMMKEFGFVYDASMVAPFSNPPLWPYTLDYKMPHDCSGVNERCPSRSYPGLWEMVINQLSAGRYTCAMMDSCPSHLTGNEIYKMLHHNFERHYSSNRAPLGLYFHATWFQRPDYLKAFQRFLDDMVNHKDVWFVTNWQAIQWMRNPIPISKLYNFEPWMCKDMLEPQEMACHSPNTCKLHSRVLNGERYLQTCVECPKQYPWIRNEFGQQ